VLQYLATTLACQTVLYLAITVLTICQSKQIMPRKKINPIMLKNLTYQQKKEGVAV
jgi:hypothetical protein